MRREQLERDETTVANSRFGIRGIHSRKIAAEREGRRKRRKNSEMGHGAVFSKKGGGVKSKLGIGQLKGEKH